MTQNDIPKELTRREFISSLGKIFIFPFVSDSVRGVCKGLKKAAGDSVKKAVKIPDAKKGK